MTRDQLAQRMLSNEASIESEKLRTGDLTTDEWTRLSQAGTNLSNANIYFDETPGITVPEMKAKLRRVQGGKVDLVIIDYLGLMQSAKKTENRVQEVSDITRNLKAMAKELNVPVIACAQLSRGTEAKGKSHKPALADLRESGSIEQDADIVMFIYRENYYKSETEDSANPENMPDPNKAEIIVAKNRHGSVDTVELYWDGKFTRFASQDVFH
jgi:replicative DNA helicase